MTIPFKKKYPEFDLDQNIIGPKSPKQYDFMHSEANITVFGGAAGAGKSYLGVMVFLKHVHLKNFRGVLVRRTTPQLTGPGGLLEKATKLFELIDPKVQWKPSQDHFQFSSGAKIFLRHFQDLKAKDNFQGWEVNKFLVDEGQQFDEEMVVYLLSRMRNPECPEVAPHMKITCNPDYDSFLRHWLEWWLDPQTGIPIPERDGAMRWFIRVDAKMIWTDTLDEMYEKHGVPGLPRGHVKQIKPLSMTFISANVYDNPILCAVDPNYVAFLEGLGRVEKARLLHGSWLAREEGAGYFQEEWIQKVKMPPLNAIKRVRAWDISGTTPSEKNPDPDWTAGVLMSKTKEGVYTVEDVVRDRVMFGSVFEMILKTAKEDGDDVAIIIPQDPGAAGKAYAASLVRDLAEHGFYARMKSTNKSKVQRFAPFAAYAETAGGVQVIESTWTEDYISELIRFDGSKNIKDDQVDATSDAFHALSTEVHIPDFFVPDMTQTNHFKLY